MLRLFDIHMVVRLTLVTILLQVTLVQAVIFASLMDLLGPVLDGRLPTSILVDAYLGMTPMAIYLTLPLVVGLSVVWAYRHLFRDLSLTIMFGAGASPWRLAAPALVLGASASASALLIAHVWAPYGAHRLEDAKFEAKHNATSASLVPRRLNEIGGGEISLYFRGWRRENLAADVWLHDRRDKTNPRFIKARQARFLNHASGWVISLRKGTIVDLGGGATDRSSVEFERISLALRRRAAPGKRYIGAYEFQTLSLFDIPPAQRADAFYMGWIRSELHKRMIVPFGSLFLALFAIGMVLRRREPGLRTRPAGIASAAFIVFYQVGLLIFIDTVLRYSTAMVVMAYVLAVLPGVIGAWLIAQHCGQTRRVDRLAGQGVEKLRQGVAAAWRYGANLRARRMTSQRGV